MVGRLLEEFQFNIGSLSLKPSTGGVYEVLVDGDLVFSKKALGRHAEYDEVAESVREKLPTT